MERRWPDTQRLLRPLAYSVLALHPSNWNAFLPLEWFQTTKRLATPGFPSFEADVSSIGPPGCQREGPAGHTTGALRCEDWCGEKEEKEKSCSVGPASSCYKSPWLRASASTRAASARRSDCFFETQVSQDFPLAVSTPVNPIDRISR